MTCVSKQHKIKTKNGIGAMTTPKNDIFIGLQIANCCLVGEGSE